MHCNGCRIFRATATLSRALVLPRAPSLPVSSYSEIRHGEGSEEVTSQEETINTRWSVTRPLWGANYVITLRVKIAGVALDWAQYSVRAKLSCPEGQRRCAPSGAGQTRTQTTGIIKSVI